MKYLLILICFFLSGCYDEVEPDNISFVTAVGIDKSKQDDKTYEFTFQYAKPTQISGGSSIEGGKGGEILQNIAVEAPTIYAAINTANQVISKRISLSHVSLFVFSEEIAKDGIKNFTSTMSRSEEIRPNIYLAVAKDSAKKYLEEVKPAVEINPAKYYRQKFEKDVFGGIPDNSNNEFYFYEKTVEKNAVLPMAGVIQENEEKKNELQKNAEINDKSFEYKIKNYFPGQLAISEENKSEIIGMAVFKGDKMIGEMGSIEALLYNIMTDNFERAYTTFSSEKTQIPMTILMQSGGKTKLKYDKQQHKCKIKLPLEGEFVSLPADYITEQDIDSFEKDVEAAIIESAYSFLERTTKELDSDILGIGAVAKYSFLTYPEFEKFNWEEKFSTLSFEIDVDFKIRRTGLTIRTDVK